MNWVNNILYTGFITDMYIAVPSLEEASLFINVHKPVYKCNTKTFEKILASTIKRLLRIINDVIL